MVDKNRATSLQERFGFSDSDLKTGKHDEIMLWLNEHIESVLYSLIPTRTDWNKEETDLSRYGELDRPEGPAPSYPGFNIDVAHIDWEHPVISGPNKFIIGFIDMVVRFTVPCLFRLREVGTYRYAYRVGTDERSMYFEVKSAIPSAGELLRQVNMYRQYCSGTFVVVSPDSRFADLLKSQGIEFVKYTP